MLSGCRTEVVIARTFRYEHIRDKQDKAKDVRQVVPIKENGLYLNLTQINLYGQDSKFAYFAKIIRKAVFCYLKFYIWRK